MCTGLWWGNLRERDHLEDPGVDGRTIFSFSRRNLLHGVRKVIHQKIYIISDHEYSGSTSRRGKGAVPDRTGQVQRRLMMKTRETLPN